MVAFNLSTRRGQDAEARLIEYFIPPWAQLVWPIFSIPMGPTDNEIEDSLMEDLYEQAERRVADMAPRLVPHR